MRREGVGFWAAAGSHLWLAATLGSLALAMTSVACSPKTVERPPVVSVPWKKDTKTAAARWVFVPAQAAPMLGKYELPNGQTLFFGERGQRWLVDGEGVATAAGEVADETLVDVTRTDGGTFLFVGAGSRLFEANEPLGPFQRTVVPPEPLRRATANGDRVLAVTATGRLLRSTDAGRTFAPLGHKNDRFADVAFVDKDEALALLMPEEIRVSSDGGATFTRLARPAVGATKLVRKVDEIAVDGMFGEESVRALAPQRESARRLLPAERDSVVTVPSGVLPNASGFERTLAFVDDRAVNVLRIGGGYQVSVGPLGERLPSVPLPGGDDCESLRIALGGGFLYGVCHVRDKQTRAVTAEVRRWRMKPAADPPIDPDEKPEVVTGLVSTTQEVRLAVGPGDTLLVTGVCRRGNPCTDAPLFLAGFRDIAPPVDEPLEADADRAGNTSSARAMPPSAFVASSVPQMQGRPLAMAYAASGAAFLVGFRAKTGQLALFVSTDGGRSFTPRSLPPEAASLVRGPLVPSSPRFVVHLSTEEPGVVTLGLESTSGTLAVTTDEDGRTLGWGRPPVPAGHDTLGVSGRKLLAVGDGVTAESLDGGSTWRVLEPTGTVACARGACHVPIACSPAGCAVGTDVARLGWGGTTTRPRNTPAPPPATSIAFSKPPPPLVCRLGKDKWLPFPEGSVTAPLAAQADRGKVPWSVVHVSPQGAVSMLHGVPGPTPRVEVVPLLRAPAKTAHTALFSTSQLEGGAALRYTYQVGKDGQPLDGPPKDVEVAWENLFDGKSGHGKAPVGTWPFTGAEIQYAETGFVTSAAGHLSVSQGGIFVRVVSDSAPLHFLDLRGHVDDVRENPLDLLPTAEIPGAAESTPIVREAVRVGGQNLVVGLGTTRFVRYGTNKAAISLGVEGDLERSDSVALAYKGTEPALQHSYLPPGDGRERITVHPFRATGPALDPPIEAPTQADVAQTLRACTEAERAQSYRIVSRRSRPGVRGIVVEAPDGGFFAGGVSEEMVVYGTPENPCATAVDGRTVSEDSNGVPSDRLLILVNDLDHSWFFRRGDRAPVEARSMKCKIDPRVVLPRAVEDALESERTPSPAN
jgi:hypothetical protein